MSWSWWGSMIWRYICHEARKNIRFTRLNKGRIHNDDNTALLGYGYFITIIIINHILLFLCKCVYDCVCVWMRTKVCHSACGNQRTTSCHFCLVPLLRFCCSVLQAFWLASSKGLSHVYPPSPYRKTRLQIWALPCPHIWVLETQNPVHTCTALSLTTEPSPLLKCGKILLWLYSTIFFILLKMIINSIAKIVALKVTMAQCDLPRCFLQNAECVDSPEKHRSPKPGGVCSVFVTRPSRHMWVPLMHLTQSTWGFDIVGLMLSLDASELKFQHLRGWEGATHCQHLFLACSLEEKLVCSRSSWQVGDPVSSFKPPSSRQGKSQS